MKEKHNSVNIVCNNFLQSNEKAVAILMQKLTKHI